MHCMPLAWDLSCDGMHLRVKHRILSIIQLFWVLCNIGNQFISSSFMFFDTSATVINPTSLAEMAWLDLASLSKRFNIDSEYDSYNDNLPVVSEVHDGTWNGDPRYLHSTNYSHWVSTKQHTTILLRILSLDTRLDIRSQKTGNR